MSRSHQQPNGIAELTPVVPRSGHIRQLGLVLLCISGLIRLRQHCCCHPYQPLRCPVCPDNPLTLSSPGHASGGDRRVNKVTSVSEVTDESAIEKPDSEKVRNVGSGNVAREGSVESTHEATSMVEVVNAAKGAGKISSSSSSEAGSNDESTHAVTRVATGSVEAFNE